MSQEKPHVHNKVTKTIVTSPHIYKPVGPYSQAILVDKTLYVSGTLGLDAQAQLVCGGAEAQARQALTNLKHVLEAGGASLESVVKTTILLLDIADFQAVNQVYSECVNPYAKQKVVLSGFLSNSFAVQAMHLWNDLPLAVRQAQRKLSFKRKLLFPKDYPARATYQVAKLPAGAAVEIEAIALSGDLVIAEAGPCPCSKE